VHSASLLDPPGAQLGCIAGRRASASDPVAELERRAESVSGGWPYSRLAQPKGTWRPFEPRGWSVVPGLRAVVR